MNIINEIQYIKPNIAHFSDLGPRAINAFSWGNNTDNMAYTFGDVNDVYKRNVRFFQEAGFCHPRDSINIIPEHRDRIVDIDSNSLRGLEQKRTGMTITADAIFTTIPHQAITVKPADCATVFVYAELSKSETLVGIVHTGWRGVDQELPLKAIAHVVKKYNTEPSAIHIALLPHISKDYRTYENIDAFSNLKKYGSFMEKRGELYHFDESGCALFQFRAAGIPDENIIVYKIDTYTEAQQGRTFSQKLNVNEKRLGQPTVEGRFIGAIAIR